MRTKIIFILSLFFIVTQSSVAVSQSINVTIKNLKNNTKGTVRIAVFGDEKGFKSEKYFFSMICDKKNMKDGQIQVSIPVIAGVYGLSVLDDENDNGKMDYNLLGIPKEGFGFSNFYLKRLRKPKFADFSFTVEDKEVKDVTVKMKYL
ncbi:MAG TPA: DUF2141 domain-containing protein [Bacteroidales bacterium]|nr:DUF2141 domain-containing protein [Bacteroidales bacterium]